MNGITLDADALIALDRNDRRVIAVIGRCTDRGMRVTIPAAALAQAMRNPAKQVRLSRLIRQPETQVASLDGPDATAVGLQPGKTGTRDVVDAHVVVGARRADQAVFTSDPNDLRRLAPELTIIEV